MLEFQTKAEMIAHYRAVRARLHGPRTQEPAPVSQSPASFDVAKRDTAPPPPVATPAPQAAAPDDPLREAARAMRVLGAVQAIIMHVAQHYGVTTAGIKRGGRAQRLVVPRHVAMYLAHRITGLSYPRLGRNFGDRDHSTTLHAVRKIAAQIATDADLRRTIDHLTAQLTTANQGGTHGEEAQDQQQATKGRRSKTGAHH